MLRRPLILLLGLLIGACGSQGDSTEVEFRVDMTEAMARGEFNPGSHSVGVRGSVRPLSWGETLLATDLDGDGVYLVSAVFERSWEPLRYKFKIERPGQTNAGWEEGQDRLVPRTRPRATVKRPFNEPPPETGQTITGTVRTHPDMESEFLDLPRDIYVYLPPGYQRDPDRRYPVLYMHDGHRLFAAEEGSGFEWSADESAEKLIWSRDIEPVIIVGVAATTDRNDEYTPTARRWAFDYQRVQGGPDWEGAYRTISEPSLDLVIRRRAGQYEAMLPYEATWTPALEAAQDSLYLEGPRIALIAGERQNSRVMKLRATREDQGGRGRQHARFIMDELKPFIDSEYRTDSSRVSIGGSSLGGLAAIYMATQYPEAFEGVLAVSPSVWWDELAILDLAAGADFQDTRVWIDAGSDEAPGMVENARELYDVVVSRSSSPDRVRFTEARGATHNELAWAARFPQMLEFLYGR